MKLHRFEVGKMSSNAYLLENESTGEGILIDCGGDAEKLLLAIAQEGIDLKAILLTHGHGDHIEGVQRVADATGCRIYIHKMDADYLKKPNWNLSPMIYGAPVTVEAPVETVENGDEIAEAGFSVKVIHTPGHTPGSACFLVGSCLFTGDTLFLDSIGAQFPPHGDTDAEIHSIRRQLFSLKEDYVCYPGHGESTTLFYEMKNNMYCRI